MKRTAAYASPLLKLLKGGMKLSGESATAVDQLVSVSLNKYYTDNKFLEEDDTNTGKYYVEQLIEYLQFTFDMLNNSAGLATIPGKVETSQVEGEYKYFINGTVSVKDIVDGLIPNSDSSGGST